MLCSQCGKENAGKTKYCTHCGSRLGEMENSDTQRLRTSAELAQIRQTLEHDENSQEEQDEPRPSAKASFKIPDWVYFLAAFIVIAYFVSKYQHHEQSPSPNPSSNQIAASSNASDSTSGLSAPISSNGQEPQGQHNIESEPKPSLYLFSSPADLKRRFNAISKSRRSDLRIGRIVFNSNSFTCILTQSDEYHYVMLAAPTDSGGVSTLTEVVSCSGDPVCAAKALVIMTFLIDACDSSLSANGPLKILERLGIANDNVDFSHFGGNAVVKNGISYNISASQSLGVWFTIEKTGSSEPSSN